MVFYIFQSSSKLKENEVKEPTIHVSELDLNIDLTNMVQNAFETIDKVSLECENHIGEDSCNINEDSEYGNQATSDKVEGNEDVDAIKFSSLMEDAKKPLFEGCKRSKLFSILCLYNLKVVHGWSQTSFDELLTLLHEHLFLESNELPCSTYEAKKVIKDIGLGYHTIHACVNDCILYRGEYESLNSCPICKESRWRKPQSKVPQKVLRHFPIIPRLQRFYRYL